MSPEHHRQRQQGSTNWGASSIAATTLLLLALVWVFFGGEGGEVTTHSNNDNSHDYSLLSTQSPSERALMLILFFCVLFPFFPAAVLLRVCCHVLCNRNNNNNQTRQNRYDSVGQDDNNDAEIALVAVQCTDTDSVVPEAAAIVHCCTGNNSIPEVAAKEELPDAHGNRNFEFFSIIDDQLDPVAQVLMSILENGDWKAIRDYLNNTIIAHKNDTNHDERAYYFYDIVQEQVRQTWANDDELFLSDDMEASFCPWLDDWVNAEPDNVDCRILRACIGTQWAWHARSSSLSGGAAVVPRRLEKIQKKAFRQRLKEASAELEVANTLCPQDPLVYTTAVTLALALKNRGIEMMEVDTSLDRITNLADEPYFYHFHVQALQYYSKQWHGSHDEMFSYVHSVTTDLPSGHPLWVLVPMAHLERTSMRPSRSYWKKKEVIREIGHAYHQAFPDGVSETTITSKNDAGGFGRYQEWWICRNYFAYVLFQCGQSGPARRQIRVIGKRPTEKPWGNLRNYKETVTALGFDLQIPATATAAVDNTTIASVVCAEIV
eukprot:scaffold3596_cov126-Cylindrotheca_fusiformis.AAC.4